MKYDLSVYWIVQVYALIQYLMRNHVEGRIYSLVKGTYRVIYRTACRIQNGSLQDLLDQE